MVVGGGGGVESDYSVCPCQMGCQVIQFTSVHVRYFSFFSFFQFLQFTSVRLRQVMVGSFSICFLQLTKMLQGSGVTQGSERPEY